jgi:heme ABC exporter ATP-binding subunit CcmA
MEQLVASADPGASIVRLRDVVVVLGRFPALAGADLTVERGEIVLLRGPNGAGKSTILRTCAGLVPVVRGDATVAGCDLRLDRRAVRRRVGLLAHANGLYDELTVAENVRFWGRASGADDTEIAEAVHLLGLDGRLAAQRVSGLSAGQRRRVALAVLVARRPELWLLDEPHAGLDADARDLLDATVRRAVVAGATVVFASHELDRAHDLADRVVVVDAGRTSAGAPAVAADTC